jgi:hypothetical protein
MKSPTPHSQAIALATIGIVTGAGDQVPEPIPVHFNPVSLQLTVSNELKDTGNAQRKQFVAKTTTKLTMDLVFDTTDTGQDVMLTTRKLQAFIAPQSPPGQAPPKEAPPPLVLFDWGTLRFKGIAESYKETIDFFSANGVPLRSSINLTLSRQDAVFDKPADNAPKDAGSVDDDLFDAPADSAAGLAKSAKAPGAARAVAAANGQASLRFGTGAGLTVGASIQLNPPVAFASAGAELSLGGGIGVGAGIGVSGGIGVGTSGSAGIASLASLSATEGAFSDLRPTVTSSAGLRLDPSRLVPKISSTRVATDAGASFKVGGKASFEGAAGLRADVGATGKLTFDAR